MCLWVNEVRGEREGEGRGEVGVVQLGKQPESEPEAASAEANWRISLPHNLEIPSTLFSDKLNREDKKLLV